MRGTRSNIVSVAPIVPPMPWRGEDCIRESIPLLYWWWRRRRRILEETRKMFPTWWFDVHAMSTDQRRNVVAVAVVVGMNGDARHDDFDQYRWSNDHDDWAMTVR